MYKFTPEDNLHGFYLVRTSAIYKQLGHTNFAPQVDDLARSLCLGLWQGQELSEDHVLAVNALYSKGRPQPTYLYWELVSAVSAYPGLEIPDFFRVLVVTNQAAAEALLRFLRELLLRLADPNLSLASETDFISESAKLLEGVVLSKDPLGFRGEATAKAAPKTAAAKPAAKEPEPELPPPEDLDALLAELDGLVGLGQIKRDVRSLINLIKVRKLRVEHELAVPELSLHMVFTGNPGTGKTTVARLLARLYRSIGVLEKGTMLEVDRSGLVAGFVGQTALKTREAIEKARGGVLFVDEAYSLVPDGSGSDFGQEAISTILKAMEDLREELVVIVAGYPEPMERFISSNPGLESRFGKYFRFEDYNGDELLRIFHSMCEKNQYVLEPEAETFSVELLQGMYDDRDENFGNARDVRNVFERMVANQANRVAALEAPDRAALMNVTKADIVGGGEDEGDKAEEAPEAADEGEGDAPA